MLTGGTVVILGEYLCLHRWFLCCSHQIKDPEHEIFIKKKISFHFGNPLVSSLVCKVKSRVPFTKDFAQMTSNSKWAWGKLEMVQEQPETEKTGKVSWRETCNLVPAEERDKLYIVLRLTWCIKTNHAASFRDKHGSEFPGQCFPH